MESILTRRYTIDLYYVILPEKLPPQLNKQRGFGDKNYEGEISISASWPSLDWLAWILSGAMISS